MLVRARPFRRPPSPAAAVTCAVAVGVWIALAGPSWGWPGLHAGAAAWRLLSPAPFLLTAVLILLAPRHAGDRTPWRLLAGGAAAYGIAAAVLQYSLQAGVDVGIPYWSDAIWMVAYGLLSAGLLWLAAASNRGLRFSVLFDAPLAALALMTIAAATVFNSHISHLGHGWSGLTSLAYPLWDLVLVGAVALLLVSTGLRSAGPWLWVAAAATTLVVADAGYLARAASGDLSPAAWYHPLYGIAFFLLAAGAWAPPQPACRVPASTGALAAAAATIAGVVLVWDHYERLSAAAIVLAAASLAAVGAQLFFAVSELRQLTDEEQLALTDELTGLANRRRLVATLDHELTTSEPLAFALIDIDRFTDINASLGHTLGDHLLQQMGARLQAGLAEGTFVARTGGDEFAVVAAQRTGIVDGAQLAEQIVASLSEPIALGDVSLPVSVSIGVAQAPGQAVETKDLIRCADVAQHHAKTQRTSWALYDADHDAFTLTRLQLGADLHAALRRGELFVEYQPIVDARTGALLRAEALVRWRHPVYGLVRPDAFLPIAEHVGAMPRVTEQVLGLALADCRRWQQDGVSAGVSVNLAASDLLDADLPDRVAQALRHSGLAAEHLHLEVTESGILSDPARAAAVAGRLREQGVSLHIDDFGTGHASLAYLREFPVDVLKIDRSYISSMSSNQTDAAIVHAAITLSHDLGLTVTIEGIEDETDRDRAIAAGADTLQGFLIGRPAGAQQLRAFAVA